MSNDIPAPVERALDVMASNRYMVLSTVDADGPWSAALAYVALRPNRLYFISSTWSRHARAIAADERVSGVIFNSQASTEEAESIQFSGTSRAVRDRDVLRRVQAQGARRDGNDPPTDADLDGIMMNDELDLYEVSVDQAFVLDQRAFLDKGVDAREAVDIRAVFARSDVAAE